MLSEQVINAEYKQAVKDLSAASESLVSACSEGDSQVDYWSRQIIKHRTRVRVLKYVLEGKD